MSKDDWAEMKKNSAFYLVGIMKEFVNGCLGYRDLPKFHS